MTESDSGLKAVMTLDKSVSDEAGRAFRRIAGNFLLLFFAVGCVLVGVGLRTSIRLARQERINHEAQEKHGAAMSVYEQELSQRREQIRYYEFMALLEDNVLSGNSAVLDKDLPPVFRMLLMSGAVEHVPLSVVREKFALSFVVGSDIVALAGEGEVTLPALPEAVQVEESDWMTSTAQINEAYKNLRQRMRKGEGGFARTLPDINGALIYHMIQNGAKESVFSLLEEYRAAFESGDDTVSGYVVASCSVALQELKATLSEEAQLPVLSHKIGFETLKEKMEEACQIAQGYYTAVLHDRERQILAFIQEHVTDPEMYASSVAEAFAVSVNEVQRVVRKTQEVSFNVFVENLRMKEALRLLRETTMPVADVCTHCGYNNRTTFYRIFRKYYNCSPGDVRR